MDLNLIEEQLKKIPEEIKRAFFSIETYKKIDGVGRKNGLRIDQIDILVEETGYAMIGLKPASRFIENISKRLEIKEEIAKKIADEINTDVLQDVRRKIQESNTEITGNVSNKNVGKLNKEKKELIDNSTKIEKAGRFTIERTNIRHEPVENVPIDERSSILSAIENPESIGKEDKKPAVLEHETFTEPLSDQLLDAPPSNPEKKPKGPDMYREPWE